MDSDNKRNCENLLSGTLNESFASSGCVFQHMLEVAIATLATSGSNSEIGVDTLTQSVLRVLERVFKTMLEWSKVEGNCKCAECECKGHGKTRIKRGPNSSNL